MCRAPSRRRRRRRFAPRRRAGRCNCKGATGGLEARGTNQHTTSPAPAAAADRAIQRAPEPAVERGRPKKLGVAERVPGAAHREEDEREPLA